MTMLPNTLERSYSPPRCKFAAYHREREYAHEMGDPKLAEVEAASADEAERLTVHLGLTCTIAVPITLQTQRDQPVEMTHG
jgi:hypothetical protein